MNLSSYYNDQSAKNFRKLEHSPNLSFLIYRDIPWLLKKYLNSGKTLDFGCGPGISTRFVAKLGFDTIGVDINKEMLKEAFSKPDGIPFAWIEHGKLPFSNNHFDLVLSIMVLLEIPSLFSMQQAVNEISRVLKPGGIFLAVVGSEHFHQQEWFNKGPIGFDKNRTLNSGDVFYTSSKTTGITFKDYFYSNQDYITILNNSNLHVIEQHFALGLKSDNMPWEIELSLNPFTHYICQKII